MKNSMKLMTCAAAAALLAAGCAKDQPIAEQGDGTTGSITIRVAPDNPGGSRALLNDNLLVQAYENKISNFDVYVFDQATGFLEASAYVTNGSTEKTITGITTAGTKRVVVIANIPSSSPDGIPTIMQGKSLGSYQDLASAYVTLQEQLITDDIISNVTGAIGAASGLLMTGETQDVTLSATEEKEVPVVVKRVVSKIELGTISFDSSITLEELLKFNLTGASIQKAVEATTMGTGEIVPITAPAPLYFGGYNTLTTGGTTSNRLQSELAATFPTALISNVADTLNKFVSSLGLTVESSLLPGISIDLGGLANGLFDAVGGLTDPLFQVTGLNRTLGQIGGTLTSALSGLVGGAYWYVLPNNSTANPTLLTLKGSYDGRDQYYPIEINLPESGATAADSTLIGKLLQRNTRYIVNVQFLNLVGSPDPDAPADQASMKIVVSAAPWAGPVTQNTTW